MMSRLKHYVFDLKRSKSRCPMRRHPYAPQPPMRFGNELLFSVFDAPSSYTTLMWVEGERVSHQTWAASASALDRCL